LTIKDRELDEPDQWVRLAYILARCGFSRAHFYALRKQGRAPQGHPVTPRVTVYSRTEVDTFLRSPGTYVAPLKSGDRK
jgi:predicted DNA-binding transcriptional regulator AlpA